MSVCVICETRVDCATASASLSVAALVWFPGERLANTRALVLAAGVDRKVHLRLTATIGAREKSTHCLTGTPTPGFFCRGLLP